jgi:phage recombination protein Bet
MATDATMAPYTFTAVVLDSGKMELIKRTIFREATDDELQLFKYVCEKRQLDPFAKQIYARKQRQKIWNKATRQEEWVEQVLFITGIDGFRVIAERSRKYCGQLGPFFTADGKEWLDCWIQATPPKAAKVGILRLDFKEPIWAMARFDAYCPRNERGEAIAIWKTMPEGQIAKCAEALALRRAFPEDLSGLYTSDEMQQELQSNPPHDSGSDLAGKSEIIPPTKPTPAIPERAGSEQVIKMVQNVVGPKLMSIGGAAVSEKKEGDGGGKGRIVQAAAPPKPAVEKEGNSAQPQSQPEVMPAETKQPRVSAGGQNTASSADGQNPASGQKILKAQEKVLYQALVDTGLIRESEDGLEILYALGWLAGKGLDTTSGESKPESEPKRWLHEIFQQLNPRDAAKLITELRAMPAEEKP